jgi:SAM-dependent methyltransferase
VIRFLSLALLLGLALARPAAAQNRPAAPAKPATDPAIEQERQRWNRSLVRDTAYKFSRQPNALLVETVRGRKPGKALDIGMGQGRNSLFLARQGWDVTGLDIADEAVAEARAQARREKLRLNAVVTPMETFDLGTARYDLIAYVYEGCFAEQNGMVEKVKAALKPGGVLVFEFFHREAGLAMNRPEFGCASGAVQALFAQDARFKVVRYEEAMGLPDFWGSAKRAQQPMKLVYCVVQKL